MNVKIENPIKSQRALWIATSSLLIAAFMNLLDASIVNLALPSIQKTLNASAAQLEWVLLIYILTFAAGLMPLGRLGDIFGRDRMFIAGLTGFMIFSIACGFAPNIEVLIVSRGLKGLAAAMMVPQVLAIIHVIFSPKERGKAIAYFGMVSGLGAIAGPVVGGILVSANIVGLEWRPIFLINVPLGIISLIGVLAFMPKLQSAKRISLDWLGAILFALAIISLIFPLVEGRQFGWPVWSFGLLATSLILGFIFVKYQAYLQNTNQSQILPISLLKDRSFIIGIVTVIVFFSGIAGVIFALAIFLQTGLGFSALEAGIALAPHPASAVVASLLSSRLGARWLDGRVILGACALLLGMVWLQYIIGHAADELTGQDILPALIFIGFGMGVATVALFQNILSRVSGPDAGAGSGVMQAFQQVGIALGIAIIGQIFFTILGINLVQENYSTAIQSALWYPIGAYILLIILSSWTALRNQKERKPTK